MYFAHIYACGAELIMENRVVHVSSGSGDDNSACDLSKFRSKQDPNMIPLKQIEHGFGYVLMRSAYTPYSICFRVTIYPQNLAACKAAVTGAMFSFSEPQGLGPQIPAALSLFDYLGCC